MQTPDHTLDTGLDTGHLDLSVRRGWSLADNADSRGAKAKTEAELASQELGGALGVLQDQRGIGEDVAQGLREREADQAVGAVDSLRQHDALWTKKLVSDADDGQHESQADFAREVDLHGSHIATTQEAQSERSQEILGGKAKQHATLATSVDRWLDDEPEDEPDKDVLEDGQDQSPEEMERLKKLRREQEKADKKKRVRKGSVEAVRSVVNDMIRQKEVGSAVAKDAGKTDIEKASEVFKQELSKEQAAQQFVDNLAKSKASEEKPEDTPARKKATVSLAAMAEEAAKDRNDEREYLRGSQKGLSKVEKSFLYQMSDILTISGGSTDSGGESLQMKVLTEEEANQADAEEWNSIRAYGASDEDLVTFLQVTHPMELKHSNEAFRFQTVKAALAGLPLLSIDLVKAAAVDNLVFVTCASWEYYDFLLNWAAHLRRIGVTNFLVGALDRQTSLGLAALGIPGFQMYPGGNGADSLPTGDFRTQDHKVHKLSRQKVALARLFTDFGYDIVLSDADLVWMRDPRPFFSQHMNADILVASNELSSALKPGDLGLEPVEAVQKELSISVMYMRHSQDSSKFVKEWDAMLAASTDRFDQIAFNTLVSQHTTPLRQDMHKDRLAMGPQRHLAVGVLPVVGFMNGHTYFVQKLHEGQMQPYSVHVNMNEGSLKGKRHRLREAGLWLDPPHYYDTSTRFIQVSVEEPPVPPRGMTDSQLLQLHNTALSKQLLQVRAGIALAVALKRTLILPKLTCLCDRAWEGLEQCRAPGAPDMPLPFTCPLDYVLDPGLFDDPGRHHGSRVEIREHTFLEHPMLPQAVRDSMVSVLPSSSHEFPLPGFLSEGRASQVHVEGHMPVDSLQAALDGQLGVQVLSFQDADHTFGGFTDLDWAKNVASRIARLSGVWCCGKGPESRFSYGMDSRVEGLMVASAASF